MLLMQINTTSICKSTVDTLKEACFRFSDVFFLNQNSPKIQVYSLLNYHIIKNFNAMAIYIIISMVFECFTNTTRVNMFKKQKYSITDQILKKSDEIEMSSFKKEEKFFVNHNVV